MKDDVTIFDYKRHTEKLNAAHKIKNLTKDMGTLTWWVDLYSVFKDRGLLVDYKKENAVDFWQYYTTRQGWRFDKIAEVLILLQRIRFFNRFDKDVLRMLLTKVTLHTVEKRTVLFLKPDEAAIMLTGQLYLFSHKDDVASPCVQAIYNPGDIIGVSEIDEGWSREQDSWIVAREECDIFLVSIEYIKYLWDLMK